ncbi:MAG: TlpA disulfide reductase family protein [Pseudomonadota bacterium]
MRTQGHPTRRDVIKAGSASVLASAVMPFAPSAAFATGVGCQAPRWDVSEWINGDPGNVDTLKGRIIVIDFFQLWCPGCNSFSGPLLNQWQKTFADEIAEERMVLLKIHTVFEGHNYQTVERLKSYISEKGITLPVGVDRHRDGQRLPETMRAYRTRGTPEMAVIDQDGEIRFQQFGFFESPPVEAMMRDLLGRSRA